MSVLTILIILVVSLPSIVTESVFGLNGTQPDTNATMESSYSEMSDVVSGVIDDAYDLSLNRVEEIILDGGYDYDLSMDALIMAMNGMGKAAIKDIRKKQSAYIKELLIELVTNEITEISTREVVNVLGEPV